jgi:hypothetical protein
MTLLFDVIQVAPSETVLPKLQPLGSRYWYWVTVPYTAGVDGPEFEYLTFAKVKLSGVVWHFGAVMVVIFGKGRL